jgi:hypothetical protein
MAVAKTTDKRKQKLTVNHGALCFLLFTEF